MTTTLVYPLTCNYSGLPIGTLSYKTVAGHMPYLSHWDKMIALHPVFSLDQHKLLAFTRHEWNRLAKLSADEEASSAEESILQVSFLALLHSLGSIKQEAPALPPMHVVQANMDKLFNLAYWFYYLDSKRFCFPTYKINKVNQNTGFDNIKDYFDVCFSVRDDYSRAMDDMIEEEKIIAAERALKALRNSWIIPVGNKQLWRWVAAHLPEKYEAEKEGWMSTLFCGNERTILDFDKDEIELLDEIVQSECPAGNGILHAVRTRLDKIKQIYVDNKEAFNVDFSEYDTDEDTTVDGIRLESKPALQLAAPVKADFPTLVAFIKANALWYLQQRAISEKTLQASKVATL